MPKFCMKCGRPLSDDLKFCPDCGTAQAVTPSFEQQTVSAPPQQTYPPMQQNNAYPPQQSVGQTQPYTPQPKKSNGKIIALVLGIVIIVVIVLAMVFLFMDFDGNDSDSDDSNINSSSSIVDTWDVIHYYVDTNGEPSDLVGDMINPTMTFNSDGTGTMNFGGTNQNFNYNIVTVSYTHLTLPTN